MAGRTQAGPSWTRTRTGTSRPGTSRAWRWPAAVAVGSDNSWQRRREPGRRHRSTSAAGLGGPLRRFGLRSTVRLLETAGKRPRA